MSLDVHAHLLPQIAKLWSDAVQLQPVFRQMALQGDSIPVWVGLSGGVDSVVLLDCLLALKDQLPFLADIRAVYINHQLSPNADVWEAFCRTLCASRNIVFQAHGVEVIEAGKGIEDAARQARFAVFHSLLETPALLALGHHGDDQVETLVLRLGRGTGSRGFAGIPQVRPLGGGVLIRPLLHLGRAAIEHYAAMCGLSHIEDESNVDQGYDRNYVRHSVIPALAKRWPEYIKTWGESMRAAQEADSLLAELAAEDLQRLLSTSASGYENLNAINESVPSVDESLNLAGYECLSELRQRNLLRFWMRQKGGLGIARQHLDELQNQLQARHSESQLQFNVDKDWCLRVYANRLYWCRQVYRLSLHLRPAIAGEHGLFLKGEPSDYRIGFREGGERCHPLGRKHSQTLKKILQECGVAPWLRESIPLVYAGDEIAAVSNLFVCKGFIADKGELGVSVTLVSE